jgi:hypothetical protein
MSVGQSMNRQNTYFHNTCNYYRQETGLSFMTVGLLESLYLIAHTVILQFHYGMSGGSCDTKLQY